MIPQDTVNLIIDTARIEDVVGDYVTLKRRGANLVACCPFHNEKTPSFYVSPAKGIYKCFGCGKAGNAVGFVMEQEHSTYTEALRYLAKKYNIEIQEKEESAEEIAQRQLNESLLLVSEFAQKFYTEQLKSGEGRDVGLAYYRKRGIEDETIQRFGLGWAPSGRTALLDAARAAGYKQEYLLEAGLAVQHEDGSVTDKFRERVMFPVHSVSGRVVAFSGRTLRSDNPAKYVNSPETRIYIKSRNLLGIYFAKAEISRLQKCILVEGNVDMVMMHQIGIRNVVASCGTSLTVEQIRLIHKFTENVTIMYDGDSAGIHAALRGINMVLAEGLNVKIVLLPDGDDPDSFSRRHTLEEVQAYINDNERDFIGFKTELLLNEAAGDPLKKANLINDIADTIAEIPDPVKRSVYVEDTAARFGIESSLLFGRINNSRKKMQEDAARDEARRRRQEGVQAGDPGPELPPRTEEPETPLAGLQFENRTQALAERDLMTFLLSNGCDFLDFESDSDYYSGSGEDRMTVAEFIHSALDADGVSFANSIYRNLYDAYMDLYFEGLAQDDIVRRLINSTDQRLSSTAIDLSTEKYPLTIQAFSSALTTTSSWLVANVPKAIMVFQERRLQSRVEEILHGMQGKTPEEQVELMKELVKTQALQRKIKQKIGREKTV
ncbi:MAG: DNA primase [Bacteroidales bacterium]|nr:DNA primase [Candidatus Cryptobacteroides equifaecalis]